MARRLAPAPRSCGGAEKLRPIVPLPTVSPCPTSAPENVNYGKNHNPYGVDEMPVHREHFDMTSLLHPYTATKSEHRNCQEHDETGGDVKRVQADKRVICCPEQVGRDRKSVFVDQSVPLLRRAIEEQATKGNGKQPESKEGESNAAR